MTYSKPLLLDQPFWFFSMNAFSKEETSSSTDTMGQISTSSSLGVVDPPNSNTSSKTDEEDGARKPTEKPPYTAFSRNRRLFIVLVVTIAGFFSPLAGAVYLPSLLLFQNIFNASSTVINATVAVYMAVFAVAVRKTVPFRQC